MSDKKPDYQALSAELDALLEQLQAGQLSIDQAVPAYERGQELVKELDTYLKTAENQVKTLKAKFNDLP